MSFKIFSHSPARKPRSSIFNLSHSRKLSCNMGQLVPILCDEVVPGDKFRGSTQIMARMAPMLAPIMHNVNVYTHFFFVPNRLVWNEWEDFITGGPDGTSSPVFPRFSVGGSALRDYFKPGSLADYLGIGYGGSYVDGQRFEISALPFRAYQFIYNEYYRDQNLIEPVDIPLTSGVVNVSSSSPSDVLSLFLLRNRAWEKDYFTSALPWAQRGAPVTIPLESSSAPVELLPSGQRQGGMRYRIGNTDTPTSTGYVQSDSTGIQKVSSTYPVPSSSTESYLDPQGNYVVNLDASDAGINVNDFRRSIRLQEFLENNARGGARYIEQIRSHFGVVSSDQRLQRPEFLGGGKSPMSISEVLQTSSTDGVSPQANMSGHGISAHGSHTWSKFIEEHGYIIGIMSIIPRTAYQQGIPRHFRKFDKFDYYFPEFAHLGEQPIYQSELYTDLSNASSLDNIFGYTPRFSEYKYCPDRVHGDFKTSLSYWHMGRIFSNPPQLNGDFVTSDPTQRIFAVEDDSHKMWCLVHNLIRAVRPMPKFGIPTI